MSPQPSSDPETPSKSAEPTQRADLRTLRIEEAAHHDPLSACDP
jgi:hypothetical protein